MIKTIKSFFEKNLANTTKDEPQASILSKTDLSCAALMIEVMNSDHELDEREAEEFVNVLQQSLNVKQEDLAELVELAKAEAKQATSLYEFTKLINDNYDYAQKLGLIENMWRIAFSDEKLDKYEDHLVHVLAKLLRLDHSDLIDAKLRVLYPDQKDKK